MMLVATGRRDFCKKFETASLSVDGNIKGSSIFLSNNMYRFKARPAMPDLALVN